MVDVNSIGLLVRESVGRLVGCAEGVRVGNPVGNPVGDLVGPRVGFDVRFAVGDPVMGVAVVGELVGFFVDGSSEQTGTVAVKYSIVLYNI